jgi:hypothetical protein
MLLTLFNFSPVKYRKTHKKYRGESNLAVLEDKWFVRSQVYNVTKSFVIQMGISLVTSEKRK